MSLKTDSIPASIYDLPGFDVKGYDRILAIPEAYQIKIAERLYNALELDNQDCPAILSFGAGTGRIDSPFLQYVLKKNKNMRFVVVEPSKQMLDRFCSKLQQQGFENESTAGEGAKLRKNNVVVELLQQAFPGNLIGNIDNNRFDGILALFVLHAITNWQDAFKALFELLKPDGCLVLAEECGDIQWLDNRPVDMKRVREIWDIRDSDKNAELRWFHYKFWQEYHRLRREALGKGWYPKISATDLGPIKAALKNLQKHGYGEWHPPDCIEWESEETSKCDVKTLLDYIARKKDVFTPLSLWGLTRADVSRLSQEMFEWLETEVIECSTKIPRKEGHRFYKFRKNSQIRSSTFNEALESALQASAGHLQGLNERLSFSMVELQHLAQKDEKEPEKIHAHARDRLSWLYQHCFRGQEPISLAYVSWNLVEEDWWDPIPLLLAGISPDKVVEFIASYAFYSWFSQSSQEKRPLSLNQFMLREMIEMFTFRIKRLKANKEPNVKVPDYYPSGRPICIEIEVPVDLAEHKEKLDALKENYKKLIEKHCDLDSVRPVAGDVVFLDYETFAIRPTDFEDNAENTNGKRWILDIKEKDLQQFKNLEKEGTSLHTSLDNFFNTLNWEKLEQELCKQIDFFGSAYQWNEENRERVSKHLGALAKVLFRVFLIGATTDYEIHQIEWIPSRGVKEEKREQAFSGLLVLRLGKYTLDNTGAVELFQTLEGRLDGIREESRKVASEIIRHGTKSAVAAIMARNMSHNIGSHVLSYLSKEDRFYSYLQSRVDFIAEITMTEPLWTMSLNLIKDIMDPLIGAIDTQDEELGEKIGKAQYRLWDNIVRSEFDVAQEESCASKIEFSVNEWLYSCDKEKYNKRTKNGQSLSIDIPHGFIGVQALFSIIENILRNTAKYREHKSEKLLMEIQIKEPEDSFFKDDFYEAVITDNAIIPNSKREEVSKRIFGDQDNKERGALHDPIITPEGDLNRRWLGFKEMRACATWLRMIKPEEVDTPHIPPLLGVDNDIPSTGSLSYRFYVLKPKDMLIVSRNEQLQRRKKELEESGIYLINTTEELEGMIKQKKLRHKFVILECFDEDWLGENLLKMPYRVLSVHSDKRTLEDSITRRVAGLSEDEFQKIISENSPNDIFLNAYRRWLSWLNNDDVPTMICGNKYTLEDGQIKTTVFDLAKAKGDEIQRCVVFDRHGENLNEVAKYQPLYYESFSGGLGTVGVRLNQFDKNDNRTYYQLMEAATTKIVIADERIYNKRKEVVTLGKMRFQLHKAWALMGVEIINLVRSDGQLKVKRTINEGREQEIGIEGFLNDTKVGHTFFIIHQGLIDDEIGRESFDKEFKPAIETKAKYIVVHSGKGLPHDVPGGVKFVEFSNIERWVVCNPDKHLLVTDLLMKLAF